MRRKRGGGGKLEKGDKEKFNRGKGRKQKRRKAGRIEVSNVQNLV